MRPMSNNNLIIDAELTEPPSEVSVFRDVTLYSKVFMSLYVLLECESDMKDLYWYWLKRRGAYDFVDAILTPGEEQGIVISYKKGNVSVNMLTVETLQFTLSRIKTLRGLQNKR